MTKWLCLIGLLGLIPVAAFLYFEMSAQSKILADVPSPSGAWRVVVQGKDVFNGVEVTAVVHTHDGREISLGVIDLRPNWEETEHDYQADPVLHTRIDEVKAVVGDQVLLRDRFFPGEHHAVTGTLAGQKVDLRIGKIMNTGFRFASTDRLKPGPDILVQFLDFRQRLSPGAVFEFETSDETVLTPRITCFWEEPESGEFRIASAEKNFSLRVAVDQVTPHVVTGSMRIVAEKPEVDVSGNFRLLNELSDMP
jgi:hypothetical protein